MVNSTVATVGWVPEPQGRGTTGLLWSCFATIFLCTWSAIHPNLPGIDEKARAIFQRRMTYVFGTLVMPEAMAWIALSDLLVARKVKPKVSPT